MDCWRSQELKKNWFWNPSRRLYVTDDWKRNFRSTGHQAAHTEDEEECEKHSGAVRRAVARHAGRHDGVQQGGRRGDRKQSKQTLRPRQKLTNALDTVSRHTYKVQFISILFIIIIIILVSASCYKYHAF